jgi:hypothetical protein
MAFELFVEGVDQESKKMPMMEVEKGLSNNNVGTRLMSQRRGAAEEPDGGESGYEEETRPVDYD